MLLYKQGECISQETSAVIRFSHIVQGDIQKFTSLTLVTQSLNIVRIFRDCSTLSPYQVCQVHQYNNTPETKHSIESVANSHWVVCLGKEPTNQTKRKETLGYHSASKKPDKK